jgi:hypothetical protein
MLRRLVLAGFMAVSLVTVPGAAMPAAAASRPQPVSIVSHMTMADPNNYGDFSTSRSNLICRKGDVLDTNLVWGDANQLPNGDWLVELTVDKTFTCATGGQIFFRLHIHWYVHNDSVAESFTWVVLGGTGAYAHLQGQGVGVTDTRNLFVSDTNYYVGVLRG